MTKEGFVEACKKAGMPAIIEGGMVTINLVGASKNEVKQTFLKTKLLATKVGYKHSFRVVKLEEEND